MIKEKTGPVVFPAVAVYSSSLSAGCFALGILELAPIFITGSSCAASIPSGIGYLVIFAIFLAGSVKLGTGSERGFGYPLAGSLLLIALSALNLLVSVSSGQSVPGIAGAGDCPILLLQIAIALVSVPMLLLVKFRRKVIGYDEKNTHAD